MTATSGDDSFVAGGLGLVSAGCRSGARLLPGRYGYELVMISKPIDHNDGVDAKDSGDEHVDPIDAEAATIDARSEDAAEQIEELVEHADDLNRNTQVPVSPTDVGDGQPDNAAVSNVDAKRRKQENEEA
jgi:hypothetical protein